MNNTDTFEKIFAREDEENPFVKKNYHRWKVLVVDDEADVHAITKLALDNLTFEGKNLQVLNAYSAEEGRTILSEIDEIALILLDVVMESDDAGLKLVKFIREKLSNHFIRIILRTGFPGLVPEREVITDYDINDYRTKTELTVDNIFTVVISGLRSYKAFMKIENYNKDLKTEVVHRKESEKQTKHLNNILRTIRNINHLIIHEKNREQLLKGACDIISGTQGYSGAWIIIMDENRKPLWTSNTGPEGQFINMVQLLKNNKETSCIKNVLAKLRIIYKKAPLAYCKDCFLFSDCKTQGKITVRLEYNNKTYGILVIILSSDYFKYKKELSHIKELADELSFALYGKEQEEELRIKDMAIDSSINAISIADLNFNITYANPSLINLWGFKDLNDITGKSGFNLWQDENEAYRFILTILTQKFWIGEFVARKNDGTVFNARVSATLITNKSGSAIGIMASFLNITKIKLLESQLYQASKMEAIGTLAGGIAHDFNNILVPIIGYAEMALEEVSESMVVHKQLKEILSASMHAKELVKQILTFSRKSVKKHQPVKIQFIIKEALKFLRAAIPTNIEFKHNIETDSGLINGDSTQIYQLILNLCTNASHAMEESGGILKVNLKEVEISENSEEEIKKGKYLKLQISDTGCGMDSEVLDRIFEPYFTTKDKNKGTGLGLAIVHGIVKSHNGYITVKSRPKEGTIFCIYWPLIEAELTNKIVSTGKSQKGRKEHILLVDDDEQIVEVEKQMFEKIGYRITALTNSLDALKTFSKNPKKYDLVITDMMMPGLTGEKLAREIKKIRRNIPIILYTGYSDLINEETAKEYGINKFIMKPITKDRIASIIRNTLDNK